MLNIKDASSLPRPINIAHMNVTGKMLFWLESICFYWLAVLEQMLLVLFIEEWKKKKIFLKKIANYGNSIIEYSFSTLISMKSKPCILDGSWRLMNFQVLLKIIWLIKIDIPFCIGLENGINCGGGKQLARVKTPK